jgi:phenylacetate-CoA ligase
MPFLRYRNEDAGAIDDEPCPCGRKLGRITRVDGRVFDMLLNTEGQMVYGAIGSYIFHYIDGVVFWQVVQEQPGQLTIRIIPDGQYDRTAGEERMRVMLRKYLGEGSSVGFEYPPEIERTPAGKARFVINRYLEGQRKRG